VAAETYASDSTRDKSIECVLVIQLIDHDSYNGRLSPHNDIKFVLNYDNDHLRVELTTVSV